MDWNEQFRPLDYLAASGTGVDRGVLVRFGSLPRQLRVCLLDNASATKDVPANNSEPMSSAINNYQTNGLTRLDLPSLRDRLDNAQIPSKPVGSRKLEYNYRHMQTLEAAYRR